MGSSPGVRHHRYRGRAVAAHRQVDRDFVQRKPDAEGQAAGTVQPASLAITIKIYVSTKGRIFDNYSSQTSSGPASGSQGGGTASTGPGAVFAARDWRFSGNSLVGQHLFDRGARRLTITFDPGFTSCTLSVVNGKAKGSDTIMIISSTTGKRLEVVSSTIGSTSCSIRDGNVFGAQQ